MPTRGMGEDHGARMGKLRPRKEGLTWLARDQTGESEDQGR